MTTMNQLIENARSATALGAQPDGWLREWKLVRADANMATDVMHRGTQTILELQFDDKTRKITAVGDVPPAFRESILELRGTQLPALEAAKIPRPFPVYTKECEDHYLNSLDENLIPYLKADMSKANGGDLVRLEGLIKLRCCWPRRSAQQAINDPNPHWIETDVRLYQFKGGVRDGDDPTASSSTLLVVWAPDSPRLPANPDGSVMGIS
jgi:hypothetical protein